MLTFTGARNLYGDLTDNNSSTNLSQGDVYINEAIRNMLGIEEWPFLEKNIALATVAAQQFYNLPADVDKMTTVTITVGTTQYPIRKISSYEQWNWVNATQNVQSDTPSYFFPTNGQIGIWPIPSTSANVMTVSYNRKVRDISVADYTTGSIVSVANNGTTVIGTGTSWTANMAGKYIRITHTNEANTGDGLWYPVDSVTSTTELELGLPYLGTALSGATAAYTIGDVMIIPEKYQQGPVYYAAAQYWRKNDDSARSDRYMDVFERLAAQMKEDEGKKTTDFSLSDGDSMMIPNPNNYIWR